MKTKNILMVSLMAVAVLTSCSGKLGQLSGDYFKVNPNPLVADGGQVDATINGVFPEKYMNHHSNSRTALREEWSTAGCEGPSCYVPR